MFCSNKIVWLLMFNIESNIAHMLHIARPDDIFPYHRSFWASFGHIQHVLRLPSLSSASLFLIVCFPRLEHGVACLCLWWSIKDIWKLGWKATILPVQGGSCSSLLILRRSVVKIIHGIFFIDNENIPCLSWSYLAWFDHKLYNIFKFLFVTMARKCTGSKRA